MKLAAGLTYSGDPLVASARAVELDRLGVDMLWVAEGYSFDAVSLLGHIAGRTERIELASGILPIYSRTPALLASTAAGLDALTGGRFNLGIGASGPQVVEGWHGVPYDRPLQRTREIIDICRTVWRRELLDHDGPAYQIPLPPGAGTGLGKPLKLINHPVRPRIPIYLASLGPKNVQLAAELADGWFPTFFHPDKAAQVWGPDLALGASRRDPGLGPLEIVAGGSVCLTSDKARAQRIRDAARPALALYVGGMGARGRNFYNDLFRRYGYEEEAARIQELYLSGRKEEAAALIPDDYLEATSLVGDEGRVKERVQAYREAGVSILSVNLHGEDRAGLLEKLRGWTE